VTTLQGRTIFELLEQGGVVMYPLLFCSVLSVGVTIERLWCLWRVARRVHRVGGSILEALRAGSPAEVAATCPSSRDPFAEALRAALTFHEGTPESVERTVQRQLARATRALRRNVWLLGTVGSLAPFVGLFGTVLGIIRSFESMAATGSGGFAVVAAGISEALIATAGGLLVGVLSIFAYNAFNVRIANLAALMRDTADEVMQRMAELPPREGSLPRAVQSR